jgi:hypothetical protein
MALSLHAATVQSYLQTLDAVSGILDKGLAYCRDNQIDPEVIVDTRLYPNMRPFRFQIQSIAHHSAGAIDAVRNGAFQPPNAEAQQDYAGLQALIADARARTAKATPAEVDACENRDIIFAIGEHKWHFTGVDFLLSFSLPNFYFHATTAYDILRSKGVPLGKRDYIGAVRWTKL